MKTIINDTKNFSGNVLCLGVTDDKVLASLNKNSKVEVYTINRTVSKGIFSRRKKIRIKDGKKINMKKLRKTFKKKSIEYMICNYNEIYEYFKYFIADSVSINKKMLYIYGESKNIDPNILAKRFKRYNATVKVEIDNDNFIIIINNKNSKTNWLKNMFYIIVDSFHNIGDMISAALIS